MKKLLLIALAAVLVVAFCAPAMAATKKVGFYGDIRFNTYWVKKNEDYYGNYMKMDNAGDKSDSDLLWDADFADSRFGARFAEGPISANVEIRPNNGSYFRQWWGQWDMGPAQLLVGHTYTPACIAMGLSQFDSESGVVFGDFMSRLRTTQIRLTVPFSMGKFVVALQNVPTPAPDVHNAKAAAAIQSYYESYGYNQNYEPNKPPQLKKYLADVGPGKSYANEQLAALDYQEDLIQWNYITEALGNLSSTMDTDTSLPQIEACLTLKIAPAQIDIFGGYSSYDVVYDTDTDTSESVTSNMYGIRVILPLGPAYLKGQYYKGTNLGNYGDLSTSGLKYNLVRWDFDTAGNLKTTDADTTGYGAVLGFKVNDMLTAEVGYFSVKNERYLQEEDVRNTYYLVCAVTPIKGVTIYPEIGIRDEDDTTDVTGDTTDQGKRTYVGAYWKIAF